MQIFAVNGSPRAEKGNTEKLLDPFLAGMTRAGAAIDRCYPARLSIKPCAGEFICWNRTPGACHIQDDMQLIYPKLRASDILVLATPVYVPLPREMQDFLNRLMPLIQPLLSYKHGRTRARFHKSVRIAKIVLVSTSGWWELGNFGTVLRIAREFAEDVSVKFAGALLRPHCHEALVHEEISSQIFQAA